MIQLGQMNKLQILKEVDFGVYLDGGDDGEILLPLNSMPESYEVGETVDVFVYRDSDDRLIATTETPHATVGEFAFLKVVAIEPVGAFLDWGLEKDLFLPFAEQTTPLRKGQEILVYVYLDKSDRISSSMRLDRNIDKVTTGYEVGQSVEIWIAARTDLGFKAIVNGRNWGVLFANEIFKPLRYGQKLQGFIKNVREDGKLDLSLSKTGHQGAENIGSQILELLKKHGGFVEITDKTPPETIYSLFGVSKKKYKIALGGLYRDRKILVEEGGIRLVEAPGKN